MRNLDSPSRVDEEPPNVHDHRVAGVIAPVKTRDVGGSACIVLLSDEFPVGLGKYCRFEIIPNVVGLQEQPEST